MAQYSCGCINEVDETSGVLHCVEKCEFHRSYSATHPQGDSAQYFTESGPFKNGVSHNRGMISEFVDALSSQGHMIPRGEGRRILELGCGVGCYVPLFLRLGWSYRGVEQAAFGAYWTGETFDVEVFRMRFEDLLPKKIVLPCVILAAHFFEHVTDAPAMIQKAYDLLLTPPGLIYIIVPNGEDDPTNPDHYWFFTPISLSILLEKIGFKAVRMCERKVVERERFIYCVAQKP